MRISDWSSDVCSSDLTGDGEAHVIYQRQMPETGAVRMYIPMPQGVDGNVEITATFCFYCEVNPEDSLNYTRDGLEITFRPDTHKTQKPYLNEEGEQIIPTRSEEHTSELQSLMRISYAVFCLKKKTQHNHTK